MAISTNGTVLARLAGGLYNTTLSNATYNEVVAIVKTAADINSLANELYARDFGSKTDLSVATTLLSNLGLSSVTGLANWVAAQLTAAGAANKGAKIVSLLNDFANLSSDATYGAAATTFNTKTASALALSQKDASAGGDFNAAATLAAADAAAAAAAAAAKAAADAAAAKAAADAAAVRLPLTLLLLLLLQKLLQMLLLQRLLLTLLLLLLLKLPPKLRQIRLQLMPMPQRMLFRLSL